MKAPRLVHIPIVEFGIALMVVFLPLSNNPDLMNGIQTAKSFSFFYFIMALAGVASLGLLFKKKKLKLNITVIDLLFFAFVAWVSIDKYLLHDIHSLSLRYFELLGLSVLYIIIRLVNKRYYLLFLIAICISGTVQAVYGCLQLWGYYPSNHGLFKMTGSFFNPGPYAGFLCAVLPVAVGLYLNYRKCNVDVNVFDVTRLKSLTAKPFEKNKHQASSDQTIYEENYQTRSKAKSQTQSVEHEESNKSNSLEQQRFVAIKYIALTTIITILLVLPAARSRAAWLGAIAGCAFIVWHKYNLKQFFKQARQTAKPSNMSEANIKPSNGIAIKLFKRIITLRNRTIVAILALLLFAGSLSLYHYKKDSADGRLLIWAVTANIIKDYPLLGVGQDLFKAHYMDYQADYFRNHSNSKFERVADDNQYAFNEPLNTWAENGIIGFLLMGGLIVLVFFKRNEIESPRVRGDECSLEQQSNHAPSNIQTLKHSNSEASYNQTIEHSNSIASNRENLEPETLLRSALLAILVFGMFAYPSEIFPIKMIGILCLGILSNLVLANNSTSNEVQPVTCNLKLVIIGATLLITFVTFPKIKGLQENYNTWKDAYDLYNYGLYTDCLDDYQKAMPLLQYNGEFMNNYGKALSIAEKHKEAIEILEVAKKYQTNTVLFIAMGESYKMVDNYLKAEENYYKASKMVSSKILPLYLLAKLYDESNQQVKAKEMATSLLNKEIKVESLAIEEMKDKMKKIITSND